MPDAVKEANAAGNGRDEERGTRVCRSPRHSWVGDHTECLLLGPQRLKSYSWGPVGDITKHDKEQHAMSARVGACTRTRVGSRYYATWRRFLFLRASYCGAQSWLSSYCALMTCMILRWKIRPRLKLIHRKLKIQKVDNNHSSSWHVHPQPHRFVHLFRGLGYISK